MHIPATFFSLTTLLTLTLAAPPSGTPKPTGTAMKVPANTTTTTTTTANNSPSPPAQQKLNLVSGATVNTTSVGVYTCSNTNWTGGCTWEDTSGMPRCRMIPWTDALTHAPTEDGAIARISIGPDAGNHCILYESARCDDTEGGSYLLKFPGTTDLVDWAKGQGQQGKEVGKEGLWSMLCLDQSLVGHYYRGKSS